MYNFDPKNYSNAKYKAGELPNVSHSSIARVRGTSSQSDQKAAEITSNSNDALLFAASGVKDDGVDDGVEGVDLISMASIAKAMAAAAAASTTQAHIMEEDGGTEDDSFPSQVPDSAITEAPASGMLREFTTKRSGAESASLAAVPAAVSVSPAAPPLAAQNIPTPLVFRDSEDEQPEIDMHPSDGASAAAKSTRATLPFAHAHGEHDVLALPAKLVLPDTVLQVRRDYMYQLFF